MRTKILLFASLTMFGYLAKAQDQNEIGERVGRQNDLSNFVSGETPGRAFIGGAIPTFNSKEETVGNRYLFTRWVNGSVRNLRDSVFNYPNVLYNYDKIGQSLLLYQDKKIVIEVYSDQIKSFTLKGPDKDYVFEHINLINTEDFFQRVVTNKKYSLVKTVRTRFVKADYSTNGISESGNNYDEYKDLSTYYIIFPGTKDFAKIELKKKSIKQALPKESARIDGFFYTNNPEAVDEAFLIKLFDELNN
jgi:hypothetical protein